MSFIMHSSLLVATSNLHSEHVMLTTLIYRSHFNSSVTFSSMFNMVAQANDHNSSVGVTGILLFDGTHFFQLLEGPEDAVLQVYKKISQDKRHDNLVELMQDFSPGRKFGNVGMELFDLRQHDEESVLQAVLERGTSPYKLTYDDRALQFMCTFVEGREKENYLEIPSKDHWRFVADNSNAASLSDSDINVTEYSFAFQPIIDPLSQHILSYAAEMRTVNGGSASSYFSAISDEEMYQVDLRSKAIAFRQASRLGLGEKTLTVKLLPMSLIAMPDAVEFLLNEIALSGLVAEQVVIAITENGFISRDEAFIKAIRRLKQSGMRLAIDDFGAGLGGLLVLTRFQPEKITIDKDIVSDVHRQGPKQAIVQAIIKFCTSLEISVIASGVEKTEEWMWLEAAGVNNFQGHLFSEPQLNRFPTIRWPEMNDG
jgi:EAL domain-containing protein (putative c-di-GMP-specific phosphodiesterase class I)